MQNLINSITEASSLIQAVLFVLIFSALWNVENLIGLTQNYQKWRHALRNSVFVPTNLPVTFVLGLAFAAVTRWTSEHQFGLVHWLPGLSNLAVIFAMSLVLLDLSEYGYHRVMHRYKLLWRLHLIHHSDHVVDVSTVLREHPAETTVRLLNTLFWTFLLGVPVWCLVFRQILQVVFTVGTHSNLRLPGRVDRVLSWMLVTPNMHHVHHHFQQPYTDSNFGDILSVWDRLFGTFARLDAHEVMFGVDTCPVDAAQANGLALLQLPFRPSETVAASTGSR
ncbi:MAG TPA: sterol desaturase family protein [Saprospiraceae bacterium]|nr:sterol desaturase family protein [Saprospiraceae bacterium]